jgi:hypothetical protein
MKFLLSTLAVLAGMLLATPTAHANPPCNCDVILGSCQAQIQADGKELTWTSNTKQCSKIVGNINEDPFSVTFKGGVLHEEWLGRLPIKKLGVQSCRICQDGSTSGRSDSVPSRRIEDQKEEDNDKAIIGTWVLKNKSGRREGHSYSMSGTMNIKKISQSLFVGKGEVVTYYYPDAGREMLHENPGKATFSVDFLRDGGSINAKWNACYPWGCFPSASIITPSGGNLIDRNADGSTEIWTRN